MAKDTSKNKADEHPRVVTFTDVLYRHAAKITGMICMTVLLCKVVEKAKPEDLPKIVGQIFASDPFCWLGWGVAGVVFLIAAIVVAVVWKMYPAELKRVCAERNALQERLLKQPVEHTERKLP